MEGIDIKEVKKLDSLNDIINKDEEVLKTDDEEKSMLNQEIETSVSETTAEDILKLVDKNIIDQQLDKTLIQRASKKPKLHYADGSLPIYTEKGDENSSTITCKSFNNDDSSKNQYSPFVSVKHEGEKHLSENQQPFGFCLKEKEYQLIVSSDCMSRNDNRTSSHQRFN